MDDLFAYFVFGFGMELVLLLVFLCVFSSFEVCNRVLFCFAYVNVRSEHYTSNHLVLSFALSMSPVLTLSHTLQAERKQNEIITLG